MEKLHNDKRKKKEKGEREKQTRYREGERGGNVKREIDEREREVDLEVFIDGGKKRFCGQRKVRNKREK